MKKHGLEWVWMMVLVLCLAACGNKQAAVEGKLVDGKETPVGGMKIIATQVRPVKGYEQLETVTKADGSFRLTGLFPSSAYHLKPWSETSTANTAVAIDSAPPGETSMVPKPMVIRFTGLADGVIYDAQIDLEWLVGPDRDTNFAQAEQWVAACKVAGGGWAMPSQDELAMLYQQGVGKRNIDPLFKTSGWWAWSGADGVLIDQASPWRFGFSFTEGEENWNSKDHSRDGRVFAVRPHAKR
ncbi:MAG: hypothetical protein V2B19_15385 [Pseudomonadota bacterium]